MTRTLPVHLKHYLAGVIGAVMAVLTHDANAFYTVIEDDLYPASYIQARNAQQSQQARQETVQFPRQRAVLSKTAIADLDAILPSMSHAAIRIVGRPDATARNKGPLRDLSADRAAAIRDYLVRKGIPQTAIQMETDESPNPRRNGSMYPSEIYISTAVLARTDNTQYPAPQYTPQYHPAQNVPQYYDAPQAQIPSPQSSAVTVTPVTNSRTTTPPPNPGANPDFIRFINASVLRGEMSASVALQLLERLAPTLAPAAPAPPPPQPLPSPPPPPQYPTWEILAEDQTLQNTFARWGKLANWDVKWIGLPDIKNPGHVTLPPGDFLATANNVLAQAQRTAKAAGIDLSITAYPNRVLVISKEN